MPLTSYTEKRIFESLVDQANRKKIKGQGMHLSLHLVPISLALSPHAFPSVKLKLTQTQKSLWWTWCDLSQVGAHQPLCGAGSPSVEGLSIRQYRMACCGQLAKEQLHINSKATSEDSSEVAIGTKYCSQVTIKGKL